MNNRTQKEIWNIEHQTSETLPSVAEDKPSDTVVMFIDYLRANNLLDNRNIVDIGCGKGRNALYLAQNGLDVYAFDYIEHAIMHAKKQAEHKNLSKKVTFSVSSMDLPWSYSNDYFDLAVDCFASIDIETKEGRKTYRNEMLRTLKPGGYALVCVVAASDEFEAALIKTNPGQEPNSSLWPTGKFQKNYDQDELKEFYSGFKIIELKKITKEAIKLNKKFQATNYWLLLQKP